MVQLFRGVDVSIPSEVEDEMTKKNQAVADRAIGAVEGKEAPALEGIINNESRMLELRVGRGFVQGDLYFIRLPALPADAKEIDQRQLAVGNTRGARHLAERGKVFQADAEGIKTAVQAACPGVDIGNAATFCGLLYVSPEAPTKEDVTHPDHANFGLADEHGKGGVVCAVVTQRNYDVELAAEAAARD